MPNETTSLAKTDDVGEDMIAVEQALLEADREAHKQDRLPVWFLGKRKEIDAWKQLLKEEWERIKAQVEARHRALELRFGKEFREAVEKDLDEANAKAKSKPRKLMRYVTGQAGLRKAQDSIEVVDEGLSTKWAWENCRNACDIKLARTKPLLEFLLASRKVDEETGEETMAEIPGVRFVAGGDKPSPKLPHLDQLNALDGAGHTRPLPDVQVFPPAETIPVEAETLGDIAEPAPPKKDWVGF